jgi:drug/metabolite transporter (DMT)-like permease
VTAAVRTGRWPVALKLTGAALVAVLGVVAVVLAGRDDSPGGQLLACLLVIAAVIFGVRTISRSRGASRP